MTLTELKEYVQARRIVSELEIAMHFRVEPSVIEPMARRWIDKGLMAKVDMEAALPARTVSNVTTNGSVLNR